MTDSDATVDYLDILILCSSPIDLTPNLNLDQELATFEAEVRNATIPIRLKRVYPPTYEQLERELSPRALRTFRPRVFHFLGHGEEDGLWFETERSTKKLVSPNELRRLLARDGSPLELALLNACWSGTGRVKSMCQYLIEDSPVRAAIGHAKPVADESAIRFSQRFYERLIDGETLNRAYRTAANTMAEAGLPGFNEVTLEGDGELCPGRDLSDSERSGQVLSNLSENYFLPASDFFCGRATEFAEAAAALEDNQLTGFGIWGIGGMGKTALAKELARRCAWRYRGGGVAFVDIRDLPGTDRTVAELLQRVRGCLDPASELPDPAMDLVRYLDQAGAALIVLDNLEDLPEAEHDALARFVRDLPRNGSKVMITARTRIGVFDQLPTTRSLELTRGLDDYNGAHYVYWVAEKQAVKALREMPRISESRVEGQCARVNRALSGHPKMIEIAVGVARKGMAELDQALKQLNGPLEQQLRSLLQTGLALVEEEGRRLWSYLPLFSSGRLMPEALEALLKGLETAKSAGDAKNKPAEDKTTEWVKKGLEQLERAAFIGYEQEARLYSLHQTVLEHARRESPLPENEIGIGLSALLMFYAGYLSESSNDYSAIDRCIDNALPLMEQAWQSRDGKPSTVDTILAAMADAVGYYFQQRGLWSMGQTWQERAVELHSAASQDEETAHALYKKALFHDGRSEPKEAKKALNQSLELWEKAENKQGVSSALHQLASIESDQGNPTEARRLLQRSMQITEALGDQRGLSASLHQLAILEIQAGNVEEARGLWWKSIEIEETLGNIAGKATTLCMLAQLEAAQGNFEPALDMAREGVAIMERLGSGQADQARSILQAIKSAADGSTSPAAQEEPTGMMAALEQLKNMPPEQALTQIDAVLAAVPPHQAIPLLLARSALCWNNDDANGSLDSIARAEQILTGITGPEKAALENMVETAKTQLAQAGAGGESDSVRLHEQAMEKLQAEEPEAALELLEASLAAARTENNAYNIAANIHTISQVLLMLDRPAEAAELLREGLVIASDLDDEEMTRALRELAAIATRIQQAE